MTLTQIVSSNSFMSKNDVIRIICSLRLAQDNARGNGNAATRRLARLEAEFEAEQDTLRWFEDATLSPDDVDQLAAEWDHRQAHRVNYHE